MKRRPRTWLLLALLPCLTGCLWTPELSQIQGEIERQLPGAQFERDVGISLGPLSLGLARFATASSISLPMRSNVGSSRDHCSAQPAAAEITMARRTILRVMAACPARVFPRPGEA